MTNEFNTGAETTSPKPQTFSKSDIKSPPPTKQSKLKKILLILSIIVVGCITIISLLIWRVARTFEQGTDASIANISQEIRSGWTKDLYKDVESRQILILGIDNIRNQREGSLLTDTIMLVSINKSGTIKLISIPRDLWIDSLKTKINSLYYYGEESTTTSGIELNKKIVEEISGYPVDNILVVSLYNLERLIDILGGVQVNIQNSFTDNKFPRTDVDISTTDEDLLYESISFTKGVQILDGSTALKYIRSRNSTDEIEGTDYARTQRQQQLFKSLFSSVTSWKNFQNLEQVADLYVLWNQDVIKDMSLEDLVGILKPVLVNQATLQTSSIPIEDESTEGIITNPPIAKYNQWVYEPIDPTWRQLNDWFSKELSN